MIKWKADNTMRKLSVVLIITFCMILSGCSCIFGNKKVDPDAYDNVVDIWQKTYVTEKDSKDQAFKKLFAAAESGDQTAFTKNFSEEVRKKANFNSTLNEFFSGYPKGISECELTYKGGGAGGNSDENGISRGCAGVYYCSMDGKPYWITIEMTYKDDSHPEKVGVSHFSIMNLEGRANYLVENNRRQTEDEHYDFAEEFPIACYILSDKEVSAKLINGSPILWTESDAPKLTADEFGKLLKENEGKDLSGLFDKIGKPGHSIHYFNHTAYYCYYELAPENGEPRFAFITTLSEYGQIIDAYVCTPDSCDFDNPLISNH